MFHILQGSVCFIFYCIRKVQHCKMFFYDDFSHLVLRFQSMLKFYLKKKMSEFFIFTNQILVGYFFRATVMAVEDTHITCDFWAIQWENHLHPSSSCKEYIWPLYDTRTQAEKKMQEMKRKNWGLIASWRIHVHPQRRTNPLFFNILCDTFCQLSSYYTVK